MKMKRKDRGYTLVEMIIVLAIIAVVAGLSLVSITLIHSARAKEAAVTVDSEIATLITKSKNMQCDRPGCQYAARIYKADNNAYYYQRGYFDPDFGGNGGYVFTNTDSEGDGKGTTLTSYVVVKFSGKWEKVNADGSCTGELESYQSEKDVADMNEGNGLYIRFARDGSCEAGVGDIGFYKRKGNDVAHNTIRTNGSHQTK